MRKVVTGLLLVLASICHAEPPQPMQLTASEEAALRRLFWQRDPANWNDVRLTVEKDRVSSAALLSTGLSHLAAGLALTIYGGVCGDSTSHLCRQVALGVGIPTLAAGVSLSIGGGSFWARVHRLRRLLVAVAATTRGVGLSVGVQF